MDVTTDTLRIGAATVTIHRPVLTPAERERRGQAALEQVSAIFRDYIARKEQHHAS